VQGHGESLCRGAVEGGHPVERSKFLASSAEAAEFIADLVRPGDLLLVKGSRGVKMERVVEALDARFPRLNPEPAGAVRGELKEHG
jgi:UDP-N-acetylmuramyl pentapeptide synthase